MIPELQLIFAYVRSHIDHTTSRRGEGGASAMEYLALAGLVVAGAIAAALVVRSRMSSAANNIPEG